MFLSWRLVKQAMVYPYNGIFFSNEKEQMAQNKIDVPQIHYTKGKKLDSNDHMLYNSTYMTSGKGKTIQIENISGCRGLGVGEGFIIMNHRGYFWNDETVLYFECSDGYMTMFVKTCRVSFLVCKLHLNIKK